MQHILAIFINNFINIIVNLYLQITKKDKIRIKVMEIKYFHQLMSI